MRNRSMVFLFCIVLAGGLVACSKKVDQMTTAVRTLYHCAMHPQIISDKPGECPICHMRLVAFNTGGPESPAPGSPRKILFYRNPMNPSATSPVPMKDSMGMAYIPVYDDQGGPASAVPGLAAVHLSPGVEEQIGVSVVPAEMRDLSVPIRASARVAYDPQLYSAALEHQEALKFLNKARAQESSDLLEQAESTVRSSEMRLRQMGLSETLIADIGKPNYDPSELILGSKRGSLWVYASVFDYDAGLISPGQKVELTSPALPGKTYEGTVYAIDPVLNNETRTLRVRIRIRDMDGSLRPEMYLSAVIQARVGKRLAVPVSAVMDTGTRQLVYVQKEAGTYEPREVQLGRRADDYYEILKGLAEGEKVVTSANFLIDSESRIQAATQKALETQ
jgi:Cu(I)/Ag(I) efflux system membrane fusion protein